HPRLGHVPGPAGDRGHGRRRRPRQAGEGGGRVSPHRTSTRDEWLDARLELLKAEKELTRAGDELARRRRELPWVRIEKDYRFDTESGQATLTDLFRGRSQLIIYHFMYGPDWDEGCPSCSGV